MPVRILIADDHAVVRQGVRALLERDGLEVVAEAADGLEATKLAAELRPNVVVLDYEMPFLNGVDTAREIARVLPRTRIILLTVHSEDQYLLQAAQAGVSGYVVKRQAAGELVQAIREVAAGSVYLSPGVPRAIVDAYLSKTELSVEPLTPRERQVLQLVGEGKATKEIAALLGVSVKTAESHRARIMDKLDIHRTAGLVRYAIRRGLIEP